MTAKDRVLGFKENGRLAAGGLETRPCQSGDAVNRRRASVIALAGPGKTDRRHGRLGLHSLIAGNRTDQATYPVIGTPLTTAGVQPLFKG